MVFHCCFIACLGQYLWFFIAVSLLAQGDIFGISFLSHCLTTAISLVFHCLPRAISLVFHCCFIACPRQYLWYFIACLGQYHWYFPMGCWDGHMTNYQKWSKTKVVALHCSFLNLVELCSKVLPLWRYDVKDFEKRRVFFFVFCIFLHENKTKQDNFTTFRKLKERATIIVSWEK